MWFAWESKWSSHCMFNYNLKQKLADIDILCKKARYILDFLGHKESLACNCIYFDLQPLKMQNPFLIQGS